VPAVVAIGPEGGWIPYEVGMLEARGFQAFSLGPRILRVDVAVPYILGQLELARGAGGRGPPAGGAA
jgi:RsmE family RNA methyltransferase